MSDQGPPYGLVPAGRPDFVPAPLAEPLDDRYGCAGPAPAPPPSRVLSFSVLLRYRWSILGLGVLFAAAGVGVVAAVTGPVYTATAKVQISPVIPQLLESPNDMDRAYENFRNSQPDFIRGPEVLDCVLDRPAVRATDWYRNRPSTLLDRLVQRLELRPAQSPRDRLIEQLEVKAPKGTQLLLVSLSTTSPGDAKLVADAVIEEYETFANRLETDKERARLDELKQFIQDAETALTTNRLRVQTLQQELQSLGADSFVRLLDMRRESIAGLEVQERDVRIRLEALQIPAGPVSAAASQPASAATQPALRYMSDPEWRQLDRALSEARRRLADTEARFGAKHPLVPGLQSDVDLAQERLRDFEAELARRPAGLPAPAGSPAAADLPQLQAQQAALRAALAAEKESFSRDFKKAEELYRLMSDIAQADERIRAWRAEQERIEGNQRVAGRIRAWPAYEPAAPDKGRRTKLLIAAVFGGFAASVALAVLRIRFSPTVDAVAEAVRPVTGAFLGHVPLTPTVAEAETSPAVAESVRIVRTALLSRLDPARGQIVQVTSAGAGSGKSTVSLLLARSLAHVGKRVLLVDADVRRPGLAGRLGCAPSPGLLDLFAARGGEWRQLTLSTNTPGLTFIPAGGPACGGDAEYLANGAFSGVLTDLRAHFDLILLDGAPLLGTADGLILARHVDGTLLVVRERHCRRTALVEALAVLSATGGRLIGTVFIGSARGDRYGYGYAGSYAAESAPAPGASASGPDAPAS
ncbi:MAG: AAA family ATPase [Planctomycetota bacterium]